MRARYLAVLLLIAVGAAPLAVAGVTITRRAQRTALEEVRQGNARVAARAQSHLATYVQDELTKLETIGASLGADVHADARQRERIIKNYRISFPELRSLDFVGLDPDCMEVATSRLDGKVRARCDDPSVKQVREQWKPYLSKVALADDFAPIMDVAIPVELAGQRLGVVVAEIDLVGIWEAVKQVRVGRTGYARLVSSDGTLIAHGDPKERRRVFLREKDPRAELVRAGDPAGARYRDSQGRDVIAMAAMDDQLHWKVIVEQPVAEAYLSAAQMRRDLYYIVAAAILLTLLVGLILIRSPVRALQAMEAHARQVADGQLDARVRPMTPVKELRTLATAMNDMAAQLKRLQEEIKAKERLSTFARVAAGLAHDLQMPIEAIRGACDMAIAHPDEDAARDVLKQAAEQQLPRLHRYVRDLRRLAHDGKIPLDFQSLDPRSVADQVVADAAGSPKWQGVEFVAEGNAARLWADESLLVRAISNLVGNAADACVQRTPPQGRVIVRVHDTEDQGSLVLEVADTGVGISAEKLQDLLQHDFKSTKRNSGVGLGLGVARHIAAAHNGAVTADSKEGVGSTFRLTIPRQAMAGVSAANAKQKPELGRSTA